MVYMTAVGPVTYTLSAVHAASATQSLFWGALSLALLIASTYRLERDVLGGVCRVAGRLAFVDDVYSL